MSDILLLLAEAALSTFDLGSVSDDLIVSSEPLLLGRCADIFAFEIFLCVRERSVILARFLPLICLCAYLDVAGVDAALDI